MRAMRLAVVGAGWAGIAAALQATRAGHQVTLYESARTLGGRARGVLANLPDGRPCMLDNGQHLLIGAYRDTLQLMQRVGIDFDKRLVRTPLRMQYPDGSGLAMPNWKGLPQALRALAGICALPGWTLQDKWSLLSAAARWRMADFQCSPTMSVQTLCAGMPARVLHTLIEPLCISALNTPPQRASAKVFLRVVQDALLGAAGSSDLLFPATDLTSLLPQPAAVWLARHGAQVCTGAQVQRLVAQDDHKWLLDGTGFESARFDSVILATAATAAVRLLANSSAVCTVNTQHALQQWASSTQAIAYEAIATVYAYAPGVRLPHPMLALPSDAQQPAQFVFDKGLLGGPAGLLAFVVSANTTDRATLTTQVLEQGLHQLGAYGVGKSLVAVQTLVEKRATFACTPALVRPPACIAPALYACGDYIEGPYPATLEGAVRSGLHAADLAGQRPSAAVYTGSAG